MSLGSILLRPQPLQRSLATPAATITDDLLSLITRLMVDATQDGYILQEIVNAMEAIATQRVEQMGTGLNAALKHLASWLQPLIDRITHLATTLTELDGAQALDGVEQILNWVVQFLQEIPTARLRQQVTQVLQVMETDLGITPTWIEDQVFQMFDQVGEQLERSPAAETAQQRMNRREVAILIRRLKRPIRELFDFPELNVESITAALLEFCAIFSASSQAACVGAGLSQTLRVGRSLTDLIPYSTSFSARSVGAAAAKEEYCWYATWLLENENRGGFLFTNANSFDFSTALDARQITENLEREFQANGSPLSGSATVTVQEAGEKWQITDGNYRYLLENKGNRLSISLDVSSSWFFRTLGFLGFPGDKVWVNPERTQVKLGDRLLYEGTNVHWQDAPMFSHVTTGDYYTFKYGVPDTLEGLAFHSAWSKDALNSIFHFASIEEGDKASNIFNGIWSLVHMVVKLATQKPLFDYIGYGTWGIGIGGTMLASLEGIHTKVSFKNWMAFWLFVLLTSDLGEKALYNYWLHLTRNGLLSFVTLLNYDGPFTAPNTGANRAANRKAVDGIVSIFVDLGLIILAKAIPKDKYVYPFASVDLTLGYGIGAAMGMGAASGVVGSAAAMAIARSLDLEVAGFSILKSMLWSVARFWPYLYLIKEGSTSGGTYNPTGPDFPGYPASDTSPYNLPYEAGKAVLWGQCNQGMWSHHKDANPAARPQVYAFDIALDQGDEVLAMRPGTVVDFFDWVPDDENVTTARQAYPSPEPGTTSRNWNFILIRHDRNEDGTLIPAAKLPPNANPLNSPQDVDEGGTRAVTYAVYGHGRNQSIRATFASRLSVPVNTILPSQIIGQTVLRGQVIMLAGDTGVSFHNHLHVQIMSGPATNPTGGSRTGLDTLLDSDLNNRTLPFVFQESDGVPKVMNSYLSQNTKRN